MIKVRLLLCHNLNGRQPHLKWKTTSPKMEDDLTQNVRQPKMMTTQNVDDQQGRSTVETGVLYHFGSEWEFYIDDLMWGLGVEG